MLIERRPSGRQRWRAVYHRLPLPASAKKLLAVIYRRALLPAARALRGVLQPMKTFADPAPSSQPAPQPQQAGLADYIIWGAIDWDLRHQRPQQLAQVLSATGRRVIYVSASLIHAPQAGFELESLDQTQRLFQVKLFARGAPFIYAAAPDAALVRQLCRSIGEVLLWAGSARVISLVQHPFWCDIAGELPNSRLIYDCMDHHQGFGDNGPSILQLEQRLVRNADVRLFTSDWLAEQWPAQANETRAILRNAADFTQFCTPPVSIYRDRLQRKVIGYYGAIAHWFDQALVARIAEAFPQHVVLLIGADTVGARAQLSGYANVEFTGEVPYATLPYYLHGFDVGIVPFHITALTLATNPVKVYEYLSAGKPVVSVDLPEMQQFGSLVQVGRDGPAFIAAITRALLPATTEQIAQRQAFAARQTWTHRADALITLAERRDHAACISVIVVTYNNLALTRACLDSLEHDSEGPELEIIVVDNASSDGTAEFLSQWAADSGQTIVLNTDNRGFAAANNQGLAIANGEYLVLLNNDTQVTSGWASTLRRHLQRNPELGLIGPVTNNIGNQARIDIDYTNLADMPQAARRFTCRHLGEVVRLPTLAFFCVMMPRSTYTRIGPLDEVYGRGFFEDDDYCRRVEHAGLVNACARDAFIHHQLSASFALMNRDERQALFERNKAIYEAKWGPWVPHEYE
ncbi:glycosyltransferase [Pseudomonas sp. JV449]|uniref:glycosyltransferase n=1 Tax=Pseudomonas sp. JV449 TaxID=1890658 RepID=UPI0028E1779D|nr:glycosyltransferase [Pseudomonas sp. JV449]MDT9633841.1 glycosyltransferase [Pseudomonas sp. JV449]